MIQFGYGVNGGKPQNTKYTQIETASVSETQILHRIVTAFRK